MRRLALSWSLAGSVAMWAAAPTYQVASKTGDHDFMFTFRQQAQAVMSYAPDNTLSEWQRLPFPWKFFGADVSGYFISDNGYITFDNASKTSVAAHTTLPHAAAPRGSIFAYWSDLQMAGGTGPWTNSVYTATFGTAPSRTHVIYWLSLVPKGGTFQTNALSFAIALHESGDFEIIYTMARKTGPVSGTAGAVSLDGGTSVLAGGPSFDFPAVAFGGEDDRSFVFTRVDK